MSELINSGFSQLSSSRGSQLINTGVEGGGPSAGVDFPLAIQSPYKLPGLDNIDAEEEYHSGFESDKPQHKVLPPPLYRPPGRSRNNRISHRDEVAPEKNQQKRCSKCGILGHNKKSCNGAPATDANGMRVRPRTGPTEGAAGPSRPTLVIPTPIHTRGRGRGNSHSGRGRGRQNTDRGRGRARGRLFYPPSSRFASPSSAPRTSDRPQPQDIYPHGFVSGSSRSASQGVTHPGISLVQARLTSEWSIPRSIAEESSRRSTDTKNPNLSSKTLAMEDLDEEGDDDDDDDLSRQSLKRRIQQQLAWHSASRCSGLPVASFHAIDHNPSPPSAISLTALATSLNTSSIATKDSPKGPVNIWNPSS
ncbi:hypothetical protein LguiA_007704 [Lonicera macranthoides]